MANESEHIALANRNHQALMFLMTDADQHPEWIATIAFYKAVQIVKAVLFSSAARHSTSHNDRIKSLNTLRFKPIFKDFRSLLCASRIARYLSDDATADSLYTKFTDYLGPQDVVAELVNKRLYRVEQLSLPFLSSAGKSALIKVQPGLTG